MDYFSFYDSVVAFISAFTYIADVGTDIWFLCYFYIHGDAVWWCLGLSFVVLATLLMLIFSFRWHAADRSLNPKILIIHTLFLAPLFRYYRVIKLGLEVKQTGCQPKHEVASREVNDVSVLRLIATFFESAPMLFLQLYIIFLNVHNFNPVLIISSVASVLSLSWAIAAYSDARHLVAKKLYKRSAVSLVSQAIWQIAMVTSRVVAFALFASVFQGLVAIPIALHLVIMMIWVAFVVRPDFGTTACERCVFTFVSALIYLFCFLNLKEGSSRGQMLFFYLVTLVENSVFVTLWYFYQPDTNPDWLATVAFPVVYGTFAVGALCLLLYYGCCHPSGPAPLSADKYPAWGASQHHAQVDLRPDPHKPASKHNLPLVFDVSSTSARINLWLSASLDLSKEGLVCNPDDHLDPSTQRLNTAYQLDLSANTSLQNLCQNSREMLVQNMDRSFKNTPSYQDASFTKASQNSMRQTTEDRLDFSKRSQTFLESSDREVSMPDYNLVEMFSRCKFDPSYISSTSFDDSLSDQYKNVSSSSNRGNQSRTPHSSVQKSHNGRGRPSTDSQLSRVSTSSLVRGVQTPEMFPQSDYSPISISPLDVNKLWEESQGRLIPTSGSRQKPRRSGTSQRASLPFGSDTAINRNSSQDSMGMSLLPGAPGAAAHLSLSYSTIDRSGPSSINHNSAFSESASSFLYQRGLNNSRSGMSKSDILSFSNASLPLPDGSLGQRGLSSLAPDIVQCASPPGQTGKVLRSPLERGEKNRSRDSHFSREYSPSDRQSSYLSDRGMSSDRGMVSSNNVTSELSRGSASSGFQSEESNMSRSSPSYGNMASQFQSTPIVENEISSIYALPSSIRPKRESLDQDIELSPDEKVTPLGSKQPYPNPDQLPAIGHRLLYSESSDSVDSPKLPPLTVRSRCSSSTGSSSSRFFKDPTIDEVESSNSQPQSRIQCIDTSQRSLSAFMEKSSLSAYLSDISSSKHGSGKSDESLSMGSDPDLMAKRFQSRTSSAASLIKKAVSLPQIPVQEIPDSHLRMQPDVPPLVEQNSSADVPIYENIDSDTTGDLSSGSHVSATELLTHKPMNDSAFRLDYLSANETEKTRLRELYAELSEASTQRLHESQQPAGRDIRSCPAQEVVVFNNSPYRSRQNVDQFDRDKWRTSLDKEMRDQFVSDIEKLAPRKLYKLKSQMDVGNKNSSPVEINEYTDSPYKFCRPGRMTEVCKTNPSPNSLGSEYENINSLTSFIYTDYQNLYDLRDKRLENCPMARPESLSDSVNLDDKVLPLNKRQLDMSAAIIDHTNVQGEQNSDSWSDSLSSRSSNLSRTKSPINTSGVNSAFKPVKSRNSLNSSSSSGHDIVPNETYFIQKSGDQSDTRDSSKDMSGNSSGSCQGMKEARPRLSGQGSGTDENSTFQWSRNSTQCSSVTQDFSNQTYVNYLQLVGKDPLNFSVGAMIPDTSSVRSSQHSYTDSIPWEDPENRSQNNSEVSNNSQLTGRKPLAALENTPRFSPIYGFVGRQSDEFSRKRFMSTPKLSSDTVGRLSQNSTCESLPSFSASVTRTPRRSSLGQRNKGANDTSAWTTQSVIITDEGVERFESSSLSKTTYI